MQLILAVILGAFIGGASGYLGSLMITKRMALTGGALGHLALPGIALALIYDFDVSLGALIFLGFGTVVIWLIEQRTRLSMEAVIAVVFSSSLAVAFIFIPEGQTTPALIGDVSRITLTGVLITVVLSVLIYYVTRGFFNKLVFASISEDLARVQGIDLKKTNLIYLGCIALVVALGVKVVGGLLTASLVAIPAATSRNISHNLSQYSYGSMILGSLASVLGIIIFGVTGFPAGPVIIILSALFFLISLIFVKK